MDKEAYLSKADRQYATPSGDVFDRGTIFFKKNNGSLVAAGTVMSGFKLAINPSKLEDMENVYELLLPYLSVSKEEFILRASKKSDPYEEVGERLTKEMADEVSALGIPGVSIYQQKWRFYPGSSLATHALGFVAFRGEERVGQYGLERYYNSTLSKPSSEIYVNFFAEVFSDLGKSFSNSKQGDLITSIEPAVQSVLQSEMKKTIESWKADQIGAIIMNPKTGAIYAISNMPDFDLNEFNKVKDPLLYGNPMVENVFEFGSVVKPLVMAGALDMDVLNADTTYFDGGFVTIDNKVINNFDKKGRGKATMQDVLSQSLNTGMVFVESKMGHDSFRSYMKGFGIAEKTGIDLPNETTGLIKNIESNRNIEYATASFGQGIAMTPIALIRALSSLTNGGFLITPHLVESIKYDDGTTKSLEYPMPSVGVIKPETSEEITRMLVNVFDYSYNNGKYPFERYSIATKTGTAQVAKEDGKGYYEDQYMHSFFGYFPAYDPEFIIFMYMKNPRGVRFASQTLINPFVEITKFLLTYYNVAPDR
jgi:cell division protein FtsI (penicillin-binding protein 3)/stage V sporulation protein D (sporulation-specific penicillin-binding protein)